MDKLVHGGISAVALLFFLFCGYTVVVWLPFFAYAEAECLRKGYPNTHVTVGLEHYCSTLEGSVTMNVTHQ